MKDGLSTIILKEKDHREILLIHQMLPLKQTFIKRRLGFRFGGIGRKSSTMNSFQPKEQWIQTWIASNRTIWRRNFLKTPRIGQPEGRRLPSRQCTTSYFEDAGKIERARLGYFTASTIFFRSFSFRLSSFQILGTSFSRKQFRIRGILKN